MNDPQKFQFFIQGNRNHTVKRALRKRSLWRKVYYCLGVNYMILGRKVNDIGALRIHSSTTIEIHTKTTSLVVLETWHTYSTYDIILYDSIPTFTSL